MNSTKLYITGIIVKFLPATRFYGVKRSLYRWAGAKIGKGVKIVSSAKILGSGSLHIGDDTWVGHDVLIICSADVIIGSHCDIAPRVHIGTGTHVIDKNNDHVAGKGISMPVNIGDGCWVCSNSVILPDTHIGKKAIIAAGSVVKGNVPSFEMWGGCLAKKIKNI